MTFGESVRRPARLQRCRHETSGSRATNAVSTSSRAAAISGKMPVAPLTYTAYSDGRPGGQRQGPLVNFIQAVVKMITEPGQNLSGETIRVDIDDFRGKLGREEKERWAPPESGNQYT